LIGLKLGWDACLAAVVQRGDWQFTQVWHLRRPMTKADLGGYTLSMVLGLDPLVQAESARIRLL